MNRGKKGGKNLENKKSSFSKIFISKNKNLSHIFNMN